MNIKTIAHKLGASLDGASEAEITGVASLKDALPSEISFVYKRSYAKMAAETDAAAVVVPHDWDHPCPATLLYVDDPEKTFNRIIQWFKPELPPVEAGIHETAVIGEGVSVGNNVSVGPYCVIEDGVEIGDDTLLMAGCYLGYKTKLGSNCKLYPQVATREYCRLGDRVVIHNGTVIGSDGFGYSVGDDGVRTKIDQVGTVEIKNDVEIGANVTVDRARFGKTVIGNGVKIDNLVQIAHNVVVGDNAVIVAQVGISGSTRIGEQAILAGQVGIAGHLKIGPKAIIGAQSGVTKDVAPEEFVFGSPAAPMAKASRMHAQLARLPRLKDKVNLLEKRLEQLENRQS